MRFNGEREPLTRSLFFNQWDSYADTSIAASFSGATTLRANDGNFIHIDSFGFWLRAMPPPDVADGA